MNDNIITANLFLIYEIERHKNNVNRVENNECTSKHKFI